MLNKYKIVKKIYYCNKFYYNVYRKSNNFFKSICEFSLVIFNGEINNLGVNFEHYV